MSHLMSGRDRNKEKDSRPNENKKNEGAKDRKKPRSKTHDEQAKKGRNQGRENRE